VIGLHTVNKKLVSPVTYYTYTKQVSCYHDGPILEHKLAESSVAVTAIINLISIIIN